MQSGVDNVYASEYIAKDCVFEKDKCNAPFLYSSSLLFDIPISLVPYDLLVDAP